MARFISCSQSTLNIPEFSVIRMDGTFENVHDIPEYMVYNMSKRIENVAGEVVQIPVRL